MANGVQRKYRVLLLKQFIREWCIHSERIATSGAQSETVKIAVTAAATYRPVVRITEQRGGFDINTRSASRSIPSRKPVFALISGHLSGSSQPEKFHTEFAVSVSV